jgi:hypothetical protein
MSTRRTLTALAVGLVATATAIGIAHGEPGNGTPEMQVLPTTTGLAYGQTVQVKGDDLPKGSGFVAATICGLEDESGTAIAAPGADDCAGQPELGSLVVLQENKDGTFDQPYTLPQRGQRFGKNGRFCDASHHCALVLADANPDAPAYHIDTLIQFADQQPFGASAPRAEETTTTTAPPPPTASASTAELRVGDTVEVRGEHWDANDGDTAVGFVDDNDTATSAPVIASVDEHGALVVTLTAQFDDMDASGILVQDPSGSAEHRIRLAVIVHPQPGVSGKQESETSLQPDDPHVGVRARIVVTPPDREQSPVPPDAGPEQVPSILQAPAAVCLALATEAGADPQVTAACAEVLGELAPATAPLGDALAPALGGLG